ncbi:MAG: glycoside hydrolase family 3 C-terminal domain-containing protein [Anaerolineaceae bacterium]|nr:glycoside hydrolase family 3 C-terminal domain-containing protein [Anaerolineaceae bacterium]
MCIGASFWNTTPIERLGVPSMTVSDGPNGLRHVPDMSDPAQQSLPATCFPTASCVSSTWNTELVQQMGEAIAEECIAQNVDVILGPGTNMKRSPLCGRNFEYFSEDPYLAGEMATHYIKGVQKRGVGTSLKHFAGNNQEYQRFSISSEIDERTLHEIYLTAFEKAVKQAKPWTVMCSYNKLNGTYASENYELLSKILKQDWGFEGLVVSDWGAVHDRVASFKGGLDLEMPGPQGARVKAAVEAVHKGELDEAIVDESVRRILRIIFTTQQTPKGGEFDQEAHHQLAGRIASEGMVLLKNNGLLPLKGQRKIAVIGRGAKSPHFQGGGSSHVNPTKVSIPLEELKKTATEVEFSYSEGYPKGEDFRQDLIDDAVAEAAAADAAILFIVLPSYIESEGYDRQNIDLTQQQVALIKAVAKAQPNSVVVLNNGSAVAMHDWIDGVAAVLEGWMMGQAGGTAVAEILFGKVNPSGKLSETFPIRLEDTPAYINWPGEAGKVYYGEGLFIGYRYYDEKQVPVQFPFGFGLSYTTFEYSNLKVSHQTFKDVDGVVVSVDIKNVGQVTGKEIIQVYVHDQKCSLRRPKKELKGFAKVELQPGETKTVSIPLDFRAFAFYHPGYHRWITESGEFEILVGASSVDIRQTVTVNLESTLVLPSLLNKESTIAEWMEDPRGKEVIAPIIEQMIARGSQKDIKELEDTEGGIEMGTLEFVKDMPLLSVLMFSQKDLPFPPEEIVQAMLDEVHEA